MPSTIEVLYFAGCPHYEQAVELVRDVTRAEQMQVSIQLIAVETEADARQRDFHGSPTIRVDGVDVAPIPSGSVPALACRIYHDASGRPMGLPPREALVDALRRLPEAAVAASVPAPVSRRGALKVAAAGVAALLAFGHTTPALAAELSRLAGNRPMTGTRLAGILRDERVRWNALLAQIGPERMELPGVEGAWSVKELVAHLTWYEAAVVQGAQQVASTGQFNRDDFRHRGGLAGLPMDERNAAIADASRVRLVADVLAEADQVFSQLLEVVSAVPDELLNDGRQLGLPEDTPPWMLIANNSYSHYREHEDGLQAWLARVDAATGEA